MVNIQVPDLGEGIAKVQVVAWHAAEGARVTTSDDIVELVTDKAVFHVPAPANGVIKSIKVKAGEEVPVGTVLGIIE